MLHFVSIATDIALSPVKLGYLATPAPLAPRYPGLAGQRSTRKAVHHRRRGGTPQDPCPPRPL